VELGSQVALMHEHAWPMMQVLIDAGVIGDLRSPDILRFGFTPLYTSYVDVWDAIRCFEAVMETQRWREPQYSVRKLVT
jgi:kynureninase